MKILIAGIGNIFRGDDAFGVEVVRSLSTRELPQGVRVKDFGIRGFDLAFALLDGYDVTILVDATSRGEAPGTLYTIEPDLANLEELRLREPDLETHGMNPVRVLQLAQSMEGSIGRILLVGCEPETLGSEEEGQMGLSATVARSVEGAADLIESLVAKLFEESNTCSMT
jgi:hydrogenase maturation protease